MSEWISVKDRLPEDDEGVLICDMDHQHESIAIGHYNPDPGYEGWYKNFDNPNVTHWMPLPKLPDRGCKRVINRPQNI